ncbi:EF-hand domain-containing protein [Caenorhabditis elegans]|uniref:EF-hand domain-containing protein n=1 Tax=Caenorhabditis elegans TaxID=6239 RepID=O16343_CAEEL|nr:EF-hand domain-containing protein [Caenorhabditis elegans]CCD67834.1 EF-hand domain-containing protein [Caenorhabditis elegans]|eukprot:NP_503830.2 Calcineurin-like EF-Hand Protein Family member [Caenorhabditis elegans]
MGNSNSSILSDAEMREIMDETQFNKHQILRLYTRFASLDKNGQGYLSRDDFLNVPELAVNPLGDRIIDAFFTLGDSDGDSKSGQLTFRQFVRILAHFQPISKVKDNALNSRKDKLRFAFKMYDLNKNNYITREEFKVILNSMVGANITSDQLDKIADKTLEEADQDRDGKISFEDFCRAMEKTDIEEKMSMRFLN